MTKVLNDAASAKKAAWTTPALVDLDSDHSEIAFGLIAPNGDGGFGNPSVFAS